MDLLERHLSAHAITGLGAILLYLGLAVWQGRALRRGQAVNKTVLLALSAIAIVLHGHSVMDIIVSPEGLNLGFFQVSSLIFWVMCVVLLVSSMRLPVESLFAFLYPLAIISVFSSLHFHSRFAPEKFSHDIGWHILFSILAYSILTIAAIQAVALALQDKLLREKKFLGALQVLPPLQTMEALLFQMLWAGTVLLTLSLGTGFMFFDNIRAQHLAHKMTFASMAWLIYVILLWGRQTQGWRGKKAIYWTLGGFVALMLAYFGSKLVLELILNRH